MTQDNKKRIRQFFFGFGCYSPKLLFSSLFPKLWIVRKFLKTFPSADDSSCHRKVRGIYWLNKTPETIFHTLWNFHELENLAKKDEFSYFCSLRGNFFKQTPLYASKIAEKILFLLFLSKMIFPKLFVLEVDILLASSRIILNHDCRF